MEVKSGYKQSAVGIIPEEWDANCLRDVLDFTNGKPHEGDLAKGGRFFLITLDSIGIDGNLKAFHKETNAWDESLKKGDLVTVLSDLAHGNLLGLCDVIPEDNKYVLNQRMGRLRLKVSADPLFIRLQINRNQAHFKNRGQGTSQRHIYKRDFETLEIPFAPELEQRAIARALRDVDALLDGLDRLIAKKRAIKQAVMQQLLSGQTRLPGFKGDWEVKTLIELAEGKKELFDDGDWIESEHITTEGVRLIQTGNIGIGCFVEKEDRKYIYEASFTSLQCKQLRTGDLLVCRLADPAGRACVLPNIGEAKVVTSVDVTICRPPSESANRTYLAYLFSTSEWFRNISDRSGGTTHKRISRGSLGRVPFALPPLPEQTAIAEVLLTMDEDLSMLGKRLEKTRAIKRGMMQQLLTGKVRLV